LIDLEQGKKDNEQEIHSGIVALPRPLNKGRVIACGLNAGVWMREQRIGDHQLKANPRQRYSHAMP
jgi:hypothetical protein